MGEQNISRSSLGARGRTRRFRAGAVLAIAVAVGLILWLSLRDRSGSSNAPANVSSASEQQLKNLASSTGHPIYWVGPKAGFTYELKQQANGAVFIRYLPPDVKVGDSKSYLTVATYPFPGALAAIKSVKGSDIVSFDIPKGGHAEYKTSYPQSVHLAYPNQDYQAEVYDPTPGNAKAIALSGQLVALGKQSGSSSATKPTAASVADLKAVSKSLGHPLYWIGPQKGVTYELNQSASGKVIIRYLPTGVKVGAKQAYPAVATYPFPGAFDATKALKRDPNIQTIKIPGGGIAAINSTYPKSIHLAYPGSDYQVELFDPSAAKARQIVSSGRVSSIG
jgi:hypothetical protein